MRCRCATAGTRAVCRCHRASSTVIRRVRDICRARAADCNIPWLGRTTNWDRSDDLNKAITTAYQALYGAALAVIQAVGLHPALGFVHTGKQHAFAYDLADLHKTTTGLITALETYVESPTNIEQQRGSIAVSPAPAGIDRPAIHLRRRCRGYTRARGDRSGKVQGIAVAAVFHPRTRGSIADREALQAKVYVSPAHAGIDRSATDAPRRSTQFYPRTRGSIGQHLPLRRQVLGFTRARGDRSIAAHDVDLALEFHPRPRGSIEERHQDRERLHVSPAPAGIDRTAAQTITAVCRFTRARGDRSVDSRQSWTPGCRFTRACGDRSTAGRQMIRSMAFHPRPRGSIAAIRSRFGVARCFTRARGDRSQTRISISARSGFHPRPRGSIGDDKRRGTLFTVSPAAAGIDRGVAADGAAVPSFTRARGDRSQWVSAGQGWVRVR